LIAWIARRVIERAYRQLNAFDLDALVKTFARDVVFEFHGDTPFGGERRGPDGVREWFLQVDRELGRLHLTAQDVAVSGPPWNMAIVVRFSDRYALIGGGSMENHGFQFLRTRWGKVTEDRILVDLDIVRAAMAEVSRHQA
jgi:ketosteroid isomerase-like protein